MKSLLTKYTTYNYWANKRIIDKLRSLPEDMLLQEQKNSFRSIHATIMHINDAEIIWMKRLKGISLNKWPSEDFKGTPNEALDRLEASSLDIKNYVMGITDEKLQENISFNSLDGKNYTMKIDEIIQHAVNHSTFHRGQIVTMLRNLDVTGIPSTDFIAYLRSI